MSLFIDTSAFLAVINANDVNHSSALIVWKRLIERREQMVCNNYILIETCALLQHRHGIEPVRAFIDEMIPVLVVIWMDSAAHESAVSALLAAGRRQLSLVDCSAMETMRSLGIRQIFTFDRHYREYGFKSLP